MFYTFSDIFFTNALFFYIINEMSVFVTHISLILFTLLKIKMFCGAWCKSDYKGPCTSEKEFSGLTSSLKYNYLFKLTLYILERDLMCIKKTSYFYSLFNE